MSFRVEAYTPMGIMMFNPVHKTREEAEKHKTRLEKKYSQNKNSSLTFGIIEEELREERNKAIFGE